MNELLKAVNEALSAPIKIYYNKFSGEIVWNCPHDYEIDIDYPVVITTRLIADKVLKNTSEYVIAFDKDTGTIQPVKKNEIIKSNSQSLYFKDLDDNSSSSDIVDQASSHREKSLEMRTVNRQIKLVSKIDSALKRLKDGTYGLCEETGEPIGLKRLIARPIATLSIAAQ